MKLNEQDRPAPTPRPDGIPILSAVLGIAVVCAAALAAFPDLRDYAKVLFFTVEDAIGLKPSGGEYHAAYERLGLPPPAGKGPGFFQSIVRLGAACPRTL